MSVSGCRSSEETRVPVQPDEMITEPDQPDEARRVPDHPGTETQPTVDAILDAFWDEGITDLPHLDSHSTGGTASRNSERSRKSGTRGALRTSTGFVKRKRKSTYPGGKRRGRVRRRRSIYLHRANRRLILRKSIFKKKWDMFYSEGGEDSSLQAR